MSRNATGTFTLAAGNPLATGTVITTDWANGTMLDMANSMTDSLSRTGKGGMLAPVRGLNGLSNSPTFSFTDNTTSGMYTDGTNTVISAGGVDRMRWKPSGATQFWDIGTATWLDLDDRAPYI